MGQRRGRLRRSEGRAGQGEQRDFILQIPPAKKSEKMEKRGLTIGADCSTISLVDDTGMESWLSGLRRTTGNRVYVDSVSRVQIPNSPP